MQETKKAANTLDPQRQYAQLLTLWAQGNKILRRQTNGQPDARVLQSWKLGQSVASHGIEVLPLSLEPTIFLLAPTPTDALWCVLVDRDYGMHNSQLFRRMLWLDHKEQPALHAGPIWSISENLAKKLGVIQWKILCQWMDKACDDVEWPENWQAITVLAGLSHQPQLIGQAPAQDWLGLSQLWRHQGTWQRVHLQTDYPWLQYDPVLKKYLWPCS
ncbi:MAG: hypothetical protein C7B47_12510 [Sulfobacillus thermosulfidooxidans]|uniref:Uncharacterized protein n=1 Tax=Sulfobacillus thermosulfidooxidans TaxID=28034 RepID=A0A2T2WSU7_SULTH|nr:MAG: hypothetical protein C7B47_12510 [Sulfobacillus thermosulfidooxidans]